MNFEGHIPKREPKQPHIDDAELQEEVETGEGMKKRNRVEYRVQRNYDQMVQDLARFEADLRKLGLTPDQKTQIDHYMRKLKFRAEEGLEAANELEAGK